MHNLHHTPTAAMAINSDERAFIQAFGERLAVLRKTRSLTQVQLAERLSVSQQAVTAYESGQRRVPISMLPLLADTLGVSIEELIGTPTAAKRGTGKRGPPPKLQQQIERVSQLPKARQNVVSEVLDSLLAQGGR